MILLLITIFFSYLGSLPAGMINLNVLYAELKSGRKAAIAMTCGAALIEVGQGVVAAIVYARLVSFSNFEYLFRWAAIAIFLGLAIYYISKSKSAMELPEEDEKSSSGPFIKGMLFSSANFLAVPFWLIVIALLNEKITIDWNAIGFMLFGIGAGIGGMFASFTYIFLGRKLISKNSLVYVYLDYILAAIFFDFSHWCIPVSVEYVSFDEVRLY